MQLECTVQQSERLLDVSTKEIKGCIGLNTLENHSSTYKKIQSKLKLALWLPLLV